MDEPRATPTDITEYWYTEVMYEGGQEDDQEGGLPPALGKPRRTRALLILGVAAGVALLLGWIFAGLPGVGAPDALGVALVAVAIASGGLSLIFVFNAVRKARGSERVGRRELAAVVVSSAITGIISLIQLFQTLQQLGH